MKTKILDGGIFVDPKKALVRRRDANSQYQAHGSILLTERDARELRELCGTCGVPLCNAKTEKYFGQFFCKLCVDTMRSGERP